MKQKLYFSTRFKSIQVECVACARLCHVRISEVCIAALNEIHWHVNVELAPITHSTWGVLACVWCCDGCFFLILDCEREKEWMMMSHSHSVVVFFSFVLNQYLGQFQSLGTAVDLHQATAWHRKNKNIFVTVMIYFFFFWYYFQISLRRKFWAFAFMHDFIWNYDEHIFSFQVFISATD